MKMALKTKHLFQNASYIQLALDYNKRTEDTGLKMLLPHCNT